MFFSIEEFSLCEEKFLNKTFLSKIFVTCFAVIDPAKIKRQKTTPKKALDLSLGMAEKPTSGGLVYMKVTVKT